YMVAAGECGNKNIGQSRIIDPFGVTIAAASEMPALIMAEVTPERVRQVRAVVSSARAASNVDQ
ncbi:TPA: nitrilase-related carbon-nitrogen hydrolase, partial [Escherichia coli]